MSESTGHAAFHKHTDAPRHTGTKTGTKSERRAVLKESMRHLDPRDVARHAKKNGSIVPAEAYLNTAFVNDGAGGFTVATKVKEVLDYGDAREARVRRKIAAGTRTVDLFVVHLPRTMCVEIPNYYPRVNPDGTERLDPATGEPMSRSRWVARDRDEAMRYFRDAVAFLGDEVSPGGRDSIHGWATNFDETTPHIQVMADPFAADPKAPASMPNALRTMASQAYTSHREALKPNGKQYGKGERITLYQAAMRDHMIARRWPVERDPGKGHGIGQDDPVFKQVQDEKAEAASLFEAGREAIIDAVELADATEAESHFVAGEMATQKAALRADKLALATQLAAARAEIKTGRDEVKAEREKLPSLKAAAKSEGIKEAQATVPTILARARSEADEIINAAQFAAQRLRENAEREAEKYAAKIRRVGHKRLDAIDGEYERAQQLTPIINAYLDAPLKNGSTLRPNFERFASTFNARKQVGPRLRVELDNPLTDRSPDIRGIGE